MAEQVNVNRLDAEDDASDQGDAIAEELTGYTDEACRVASELMTSWGYTNLAKTAVISGWPYVELVVPDPVFSRLLTDQLEMHVTSSLEVFWINDQYIHLGFYAW